MRYRSCMTTETKAERAAQVDCRNCGKSLSADLKIEANEKGFKKVHLGMQCKTCGTLYRGNAFLAVLKKMGVM